MGDAGIDSFEKYKKFIPENVEILKVGHHGAKNVVNSEMLEHLKNEISIISVGKNTFGHPDVMTLKTLENTKVLRTDGA